MHICLLTYCFDVINCAEELSDCILINVIYKKGVFLTTLIL